jgi:putative hydrolase of the HAD superfamily
VLLTDGWNHRSRKLAARHFGLDWALTEELHRLAFDPYEQGRITLDEYLSRAIFDRKRPFSKAQFRRFMFAQSKPIPEMIQLVQRLKRRYALKVVVVSNEGRELNAHRIRKFQLDRFVDAFISSSFVHLRKPDPEIYRLALDIAQKPLREIVYIENTPMFVDVAQALGIRGILHRDYASTRAALAELGLAD